MYIYTQIINLIFTFVFSGGKFITVGDRIRLPDDVTMGYIIEYLLKKQLTVVEQFHSHLEPMKFLNKDTFQEQVTKQHIMLSFFKIYFERKVILSLFIKNLITYDKLNSINI